MKIKLLISILLSISVLSSCNKYIVLRCCAGPVFAGILVTEMMKRDVVHTTCAYHRNTPEDYNPGEGIYLRSFNFYVKPKKNSRFRIVFN